MMTRKITAFLTALIMLMSIPQLVFAEDDEFEFSGEYQAFDQISDYISKLYIEEYSKEEVMSRGISELLEGDNKLLVELLKATLESLDDYSEFYTEDEYKEFLGQVNNTFYGIGIIMKMGEDGYVEVTGFADGSDNAQKAGFRIGDKLYKVNGTDTNGLKMSEVRALVVGEEGTTVNITVLRDGQEINLSAMRVAVNGATVSYTVLEGNIGYIQIKTFGENTASEFETALSAMREEKISKIILDLRNNGGGLVPAAVKIAQAIVPKGKIIDVKHRNSSDDVTYTSTLAKKEFEFEVLVNENTASSSEILASAMQDSKAGELVGTTTYGKAVIQNTYPLKNGSVFKLTVGEYITRNGKAINKVGLTPDVYVENVVDKLDTSVYTGFDYNERAALGQKSGNVLAAKERLSILGYYKGEENDVFDEELRDAVKVFQQSKGILSYGVLDAVTQSLLEEAVSDIDVTDDLQLKTAYKKLGGDETKLYNR